MFGVVVQSDQIEKYTLHIPFVSRRWGDAIGTAVSLLEVGAQNGSRTEGAEVVQVEEHVVVAVEEMVVEVVEVGAEARGEAEDAVVGIKIRGPLQKRSTCPWRTSGTMNGLP